MVDNPAKWSNIPQVNRTNQQKFGLRGISLLKPKNNREIAKREDGQLLILPSINPEEVGALSDPTQGYYNVSMNLILGVKLLFEE